MNERFKLFRFNRVSLINEEGFPNFSRVRVFYYNLKSNRLIEIDERGVRISTTPYNNAEELINILRNI